MNSRTSHLRGLSFAPAASLAPMGDTAVLSKGARAVASAWPSGRAKTSNSQQTTATVRNRGMLLES